MLHQLAPLILEHQGTDAMIGVRPPIAFDGTVDESSQEVTLGNYTFTVSFVDPWTPHEEQDIETHGGLIIQVDDNEYFVAGSGVTITFDTHGSNDLQAGIARIEEGAFEGGKWERGRVLNGDQSHQGRHLRLPPGQFGIQRLGLYRYH